MSTISAPRSRARSSVSRNVFSTPSSMPSPESSSGTPRRMPRRSVAVGVPIGLREVQRGRVAGVLADHRAEQQRAVGDVARERAGLVERGGEGDHPVAADRAVGGLEADDPAQRGGLADRAAGVGADRPRRRAGGDGGGRAAARPAGHARAVPGVEDRAEGAVLGRGAHRELVLMGLGQQRRAGGGEALDGGRGVGRPVALEDLRAGLARDALGAEEVLDGDGDAAQRGVAIDLRRGDLAGDPGERVELVGERALAVGRPQLAVVDRAGAHALGGLGRGQIEQVAHAGDAPGLGTRKPPCAGSGALASATSRGSDGPRLVGAQRVLDRDDVRGGRDVLEIAQLGDLLDVAEHARELAGHHLELLLVQLEAGEAGDVEDLVSAQHRADSRRAARPRAAAPGRPGPRRPGSGARPPASGRPPPPRRASRGSRRRRPPARPGSRGRRRT